jgi:PIN domain nuclease of toxin-antitoxin system
VESVTVILLDTHALVWAVAEPKRLSTAATKAINTARQQDGLAVAAITLWELAMLFSRGRIQAYGTIEASVRLLVEGITIKPITPEIVALSVDFPSDYSTDPADRLIGATARAEGMPLISRDRNIGQCPLLHVIW